MYQVNFQHPLHIYFVGIGGISMSGLAEILADAGFTVSGSDKKKSPLTSRLESKGIHINYGQREENITPDIELAIFTSAIHADNPEYIAVQKAGIPSLTRAQLLGQIMKNYATPIAISGTHGKTTATSMISQILLEAHADPTVSIGGMLSSIGGNIRVGNSDLFVTEACEYTNSFLSFYPKIAVILNIEADHLDFFKDLADIRSSFRRFAQLLPADGTLIINGEIPDYREITEGLPCRVITFGHDSSFDYWPQQIRYNELACPSFVLHGPNDSRSSIQLGVPGDHNILNAMAALALADLLAIDRKTAATALTTFTGTGRRFEYKGKIGGVTIIDDYAHHPTEITATLKAAAGYPHKTLWCVFQPHTYSRTKSFLGEFAQALCLADKIVLADIYSADRETDNLGISSQTLQQEIEKLGHECYYFPTFDEIENFLLENCINGDLLITMGAGDVLKIGENLLGI
ncbi:MAG: UDP-N-acetylmuramate--L-alanine ligase [Lachnospiraceae bacterium]|nr:UDP-N-acetylmuramate--L-alanine ligase [Lachnospiraceae bacterium]